VQVHGHARVFAIADEDLPREKAEKTSAVHFLRFELTPAMCAALHGAAALAAGIDHANYRHQIDPVGAAVRDSLAADLT
jgi:precorrin-3B methylase